MQKSRFRSFFAMFAAVVVAVFVVASAPASAHQDAGTAEVQPAAPLAMAPQTFDTKAEADAATERNLRSSARKAQAVPGQCTASWIWLTATVGVFKHTSPNPSDIDYYLAGGQYSPCRALFLGDRYSGCGYTNANGYILIPKIRSGVFYPPNAGFVISTCTED